MKRVSIFGSTGSIGRNTIDVIGNSDEEIRVVALTARKNVQLLARQAIDLNAEIAVIADEDLFDDLKEALKGSRTIAACGSDAIIDAAGESTDWVMASIVGMAGLKPLMKSLEQGTNVAIANKEPLAAAGQVVIDYARKYGATILPVDSEHNAVFQVFDNNNRAHIRRIILTASGGAFRNFSVEDMRSITPEQATVHPNWSMGKKITVDSSTLMNKALEVIEARYLFDMDASKIDVLVHPQSIIHSMTEYEDGSVLAQLGAPDMRTPISYCLAWPERMKTPGNCLDVFTMKELTFEQLDDTRFPAVGLAYKAIEQGAWACAAMNAANEIAVEAFLEGKIGYLDVVHNVDWAMQNVSPVNIASVDDVISFDAEVRRVVLNNIYA